MCLNRMLFLCFLTSVSFLEFIGKQQSRALRNMLSEQRSGLTSEVQEDCAVDREVECPVDEIILQIHADYMIQWDHKSSQEGLHDGK